MSSVKTKWQLFNRSTLLIKLSLSPISTSISPLHIWSTLHKLATTPYPNKQQNHSLFCNLGPIRSIRCLHNNFTFSLCLLMGIRTPPPSAAAGSEATCLYCNMWCSSSLEYYETCATKISIHAILIEQEFGGATVRYHILCYSWKKPHVFSCFKIDQ